MTVRVDGKVAIVTGGSSGIGAEIAREFAKSGATVVIVGRQGRRLGATLSDIESAGASGLAIEADLTQDGEAHRIVTETVEQFGELDILVNAAGIYRPARLEAALPGFDQEWMINVRAAYVLTQAAIPHLRRRAGAVLFISSVAGSRAFPESTGYCTTKGAVESLVRALAVEEAANGVRVNAIAPGEIKTGLNDELLKDPAYENAVLEATPLRRVGVVQEIAPAAVFLVSEAASYITGASLAIDGGWSAQ